MTEWVDPYPDDAHPVKEIIRGAVDGVDVDGLHEERVSEDEEREKVRDW